MKLHNIISHSKYTLRIAVALLAACGCGCTDDDIAGNLDFTVIGKEVTVTIPVNLPKMEVQSRANMTANDLNRVVSLWVATFSSTTGAMTSKGWQNKTATPNTSDTHVPHDVSIQSMTGPSYIVAVANVESVQGVTPDNLTPRPLSKLLTDNMTWREFLKIGVVSPSTQELVNAPNPPLAMAGAYTNIDVTNPHTPQTSLADWQTENFKAYDIPYNKSGKVELTGAIHMRRLVSQVTFNLYPGSTNGIDMTITPHSYRVINVPRYSWLYERGGEANGSITNLEANFGDASTELTKGDYYWSTSEYTSNNIPSTGDGNYSFNFWQGENKHNALSTANVADYYGRDKEGTAALPEADQNTDKNIQTVQGTSLFTSLTGAKWTPNNMATYVLISCSVDYDQKINVNEQGEITDGGTSVSRTGDATFLVHLGYMNNAATDFNCYRNTQYTYNITINGVNDIRVEAFHGSETPGVSGMVADVEGTFRTLDCHYNAYNIYLSEDELKAYDPVDNSGFGFLMTTYDSGEEKSYTEDDFVDKTFTELSDAEKQYLDWVELKPTTKEDELAAYTPRGTGSTTFNLVDASKGIDSNQKSSSGWYTVFVREYTYEADGADESKFYNDKPIWHRYVFANPRRYYIRTTKAVSSDGESLYTRAKYAGVQNSIMSYYDQNAIPSSSESGKVRGSAIGVELVNEVYGMNMRQLDKGSLDKGSDADNGRLNCWNYYNSNLTWNAFVNQTKNQSVKASNTLGANIAAQTFAVPSLKAYTGSISPSEYDPQANSSQQDDYIEAINACMNRNRDNNGDGIIDKDELRWYVPTMSKYLRMLIGQDALEPNELMDYAAMPNRPSELSSNYNWGPYFFYGSNGQVLWAMEGLSTSWYGTSNLPWQVRCIRNLGTNLNEVATEDPTIMAYTFEPNDADNPKRGGKVKMTYYQSTTLRTNSYNGNGTGAGQMPVHLISDEENSLYRYGFEISDCGEGKETDGIIEGSELEGIEFKDWWVMMDNMHSATENPCNEKGDRWRLPNVKELAIMFYLNVITGSERYTSCSIGVITGNGSKISNVNEQPTTKHYFINTQTDILTQSAIGYQKQYNYYNVRCVRDCIP